MTQIRIKLADIAGKLGKKPADIARETGLNRNTVSALFHNEVEGIRFETLEKLNETYGLSLNDLLEIIPAETPEATAPSIYRQEGEMNLFFMFPASKAIHALPAEYFDLNYGRTVFFAEHGYAFAYWDKTIANKLAKSVYSRYQKPKELEKLYFAYLEQAGELEKMYTQLNKNTVLGYDAASLKAYFDSVINAYANFWKFSFFIDSFDPGYDVEQINRVSKEHNFSDEEKVILTTPPGRTFGTDRVLALLEITKKYLRNKSTKKSQKALMKFIETDDLVARYKLDFDYYKSNYAHVEHITNEELAEEVLKYAKKPEIIKRELWELQKFESVQENKIKKVLKAHHLRENPLYFFNQLTFWREHRKQINLMGFHVLDTILDALEIKTGIAKKYLHFLSPDEFESALKGLVNFEILRSRSEQPVAIIFESGSYKILVGPEALSIKDELETVLYQEHDHTNVIPGQVASRGYAKGIARVVLDKKDFSKFKAGEILVTGMTRPEFVPLMKMAAAIVTNEGGITCHAAIISRELGKPCIIGTKVATTLIKDGDLIEVRANHGTVRILK